MRNQKRNIILVHESGLTGLQVKRMRIGRFQRGNETFYGEVKGGLVVAHRGLFDDTYPLTELKLLPPTRPSKIICLALNYKEHADELNLRVPEEPLIFLKPPSAMIAYNEKIIYPRGVKHLDCEAELAVVIGKRCKKISAEKADDVILGYTCLNDVTARDMQRIDGQWTRAKGFDTFAPIGPYIVTDIDPHNLEIQTRINNRVKQSSNTKNMVFTIPEIIEFVSNIMTLERGDVIATGTPAGMGELFDKDTIEIEIEEIGILKNRVIKE